MKKNEVPSGRVFMMISGRKTFCFLCVMMFIGVSLSAQSRQAVLVRGNNWITENSLFEDGSYTALFGEYRTEGTVNDFSSAPAAFFVRVSGDNSLLTGNRWQPRLGAGSLLQRLDGSNLYVGFPFAGGPGLGTWTVLFQFPLTGAPVDDAAINRLIDAWEIRFRYFFSLIKVSSDISLPAVINF